MIQNLIHKTRKGKKSKKSLVCPSMSRSKHPPLMPPTRLRGVTKFIKLRCIWDIEGLREIVERDSKCLGRSRHFGRLCFALPWLCSVNESISFKVKSSPGLRSLHGHHRNDSKPSQWQGQNNSRLHKPRNLSGKKSTWKFADILSIYTIFYPTFGLMLRKNQFSPTSRSCSEASRAWDCQLSWTPCLQSNADTGF